MPQHSGPSGMRSWLAQQQSGTSATLSSEPGTTGTRGPRLVRWWGPPVRQLVSDTAKPSRPSSSAAPIAARALTPGRDIGTSSGALLPVTCSTRATVSGFDEVGVALHSLQPARRQRCGDCVVHKVVGRHVTRADDCREPAQRRVHDHQPLTPLPGPVFHVSHHITDTAPTKIVTTPLVLDRIGHPATDLGSVIPWAACVIRGTSPAERSPSGTWPCSSGRSNR